MRVFRWKGDETIYVLEGDEVSAYFRTLEDQMDYGEYLQANPDFEYGEPIEVKGGIIGGVDFLSNINVEELL